MKKLPVFVYGTLKEGECFDIFRSFKRTIVKGTLQNAALYHLGKFPGLKLSGDGCVLGELHFYDNIEGLRSVLNRMDRIEGYEGRKTDLFTRKEVDVILQSGKKMKAYTYLYNGDVMDAWKIASGEWKRDHQ